MKVTVEDQNTVKKILHVEVPNEDVVKELDGAYRALKKNAKIKGFRPGKAPRSVLERLFRKDVHSDIRAKLIQNSMMEAIEQTGLNILGSPKIDPPEIKIDEPYRFEAEVEIAPEIQDIDYKGLKLKKTFYDISDGEVEAQLKMLQKNLAQRKPIDEPRPAQNEDFVLIDYEGFKDGEPFAETQKTENFMMRIGQGTISKELDQQVMGMKPGESKEISVLFPDDHENPVLAGKTIVFNVQLHEIRKEELPEINDDLAKRLGSYETLDDLKKDIVRNLKQGYEKRTEHALNEQIFGSLIEKTSFEIPDTLVDMELEGIIREAERAFYMQGRSMEEAGVTPESLAEKHRGTAEKQVRRFLILDKIIQQEDLKLSDEALEKGFEEMAAMSNQPIDQIKRYYEDNQEQLKFFKQSLLEKQAIGLILEHSEIEEIHPESGKAPAEENA